MEVVISGIFGRMGTYVFKVLSLRENIKVIGGIDDNKNFSTVNIKSKLSEFETCDVLIDFSAREAAYENIKWALEHNIKVLCGTTGMTKEETEELKQLAIKNKVSMIICPNFALLASVMYKIIETFKDDFLDIDLIETHHKKKKDAPSGTAKDFANILNFNYADIQSVRVNHQIASHEIIINNSGERLTIKHEILSRDAFLVGFLKSLDLISKNDRLIISTSLKDYHNIINNLSVL